MYFSMFLTLLTWQIYTAVPHFTFAHQNEGIQKEICPYENTVNLTKHKKFDNGSYLYEGILIPTEKQDTYDYHFNFMRKRASVPVHVRGCVCDKNRPCMKLCCEKAEYLNQNTRKCEKLTADMKVQWKLPILRKNYKIETVDIFKHFTIQVGLPCQEAVALDMDQDRWILKGNGILYIPSDKSKLDTLDYCYSPLQLDEDTTEYVLRPFSCLIINFGCWQLYLNTYAMAISVAFLILTILVYLMLEELRGNLHGKLLICHLISLASGYAIVSFINISSWRFDVIPCSILGFSCYFFFMATFFWLGVLCYDIWMNFKETNIKLNSTNNHKQFILYSLYAWSGPALATLFAIYMELSPHVDEIYKPGIGLEMCFLNTEKWSGTIYFYGPNLIILIFNFITFSHITIKIYKVRRDIARMTHKEKSVQENAVVILRLFLIMGISWIFDILSYCSRGYPKGEIIFIFSDFTTAIQGFLIFSLFILKPKVLKLLKKRFFKTDSEEVGVYLPQLGS